MKRDIAFLVLGGISLLLSFFGTFPVDPAWLAILLCGIPILKEAAVGLVTRFDIKADVLVSLALIASVAIGEIFAAGEIAFIMQLGSLLEELTVARARAGIEKLVHLTPRTARRLTPEGEETVPAEAVAVGDVLRVLPGETIPVDGVVRSGQTAVNQFGAFEMEAVKVGEDSSIQRMIRLVQSADAGKAKIVGLADRWATWIVVIALSAALLTWLITGEIIRAVTILVVFCPCALVLATPTAIMAAIGNATRHSFLVREGDALERLAQVGKAAFDKTGTLTCGVPEVAAVRALFPEVDEAQVYAWLARAERSSEHPLGKAVVRCWREKTGEEPAPADSFQALPGRGLKAELDGRSILAGNWALLEGEGVAVSPGAEAQADQFLQQGCTLIWLAADGVPVGFAALSDTVRKEAGDTIAGLRAAGGEPVLLTGDNERAAAHIAGELSIGEYRSGCLPEDKLNWIDQAQRAGTQVCMVGDGINDAPALKKAFVGIAMGGVGSDIAVDAADIALVNDDIKELPHLIALSRRMMSTIRLNLTFSMALNFAAIVLAMTGILNPVVGALVHNAGSVAVILNSSLLLKWRKKQ